MFFQGNPVHSNRRYQFALPLSQDGSTRAYCLHLSFITFSMRNTSSEMPFSLRCHCVAMVVLLIGQKNTFWVQRAVELLVYEVEAKIQTSCSGSENNS